MTLAEHDNRCSELFRKLDALKTAGKASSDRTSEYMRTLYELRDATTARLGTAGIA